ncbi:MAG: PVC-type heme-binding CxxCH protein [Verrucomicrobiota bacterium]
MMITRLALLLLSSGLMILTARAEFTFQKGDKICLIGNSLADRMQHDGWMETLIQRETSQLELSFRDIAVCGDEVARRPRSENVPNSEALLAQCKADVVFCFFGYNESFQGQPGLEKFKADYAAMIDSYKAKNFNGKNTLRLVLFSPIANENLHNPLLPDAAANNNRLALYANAVKEVAEAENATFVDLYQPTLVLYANAKAPLTLNGAHLSAAGNRELAGVIAQALLKKSVTASPNDENLRQAVNTKSTYWHNSYRASDSNDVWGNRSVLRFENNQSNGEVLQQELLIWQQMASNRDRQIWALAAGKPFKVDDSNLPAPLQVVSNVSHKTEQSIPYIDGQEAISKMTVAPGFKVNLFADEKRFPELANPVQMAVDPKGRLWVAAWGSYPKWEPGKPLTDRLLILTDEKHSGVADKCITFATVENPTGFEFWNGGVLVTSGHDLLFLKDSKGDGVADVREVMLQGLDNADTHHAANNFRFGPDGGLYWQRGVFIVENVETPWARAFEATRDGMYRFDPASHTFSFHAANGPNSHGIAFDYWGFHYATDGTSGNTFQVVPDQKGFKMRELLQKQVRPVPSSAIVSSSQFPAGNQGNFLICNSIGFLGIKQYKLDRDAISGLVHGTPVVDMVSSTDPNFRPTAIQFGDDGALYFSDWQNAIIGHMQHNIRDPERDKSHGRVYRIVAEGRKLQEHVDIDGQPVAKLLENLKHPVDGVRYRTHIELSKHQPAEVLAACKEWMQQFDPKNPADAHHLLEALWLHQRLDVRDMNLLKILQQSPEPFARIAAKTVAHFWSGNAIDPQSRPSSQEAGIKSLAPSVRPDGTLEVQLLTVKEALKFDQSSIDAKPGQQVELHFINVDLMPHNVVITQPGAADEVCTAALALGAAGFAKDFIPESSKILAHSKMLDHGQMATLKFTLPAAAGDYQFVCTFPGHGQVMRGIIRAQ